MAELDYDKVLKEIFRNTLHAERGVREKDLELFKLHLGGVSASIKNADLHENEDKKIRYVAFRMLKDITVLLRVQNDDTD